MTLWMAAVALAGLGAFASPAPTGSYAAGRTHIVWRDSARHDRPIAVDIWYPALLMKTQGSAYLPSVEHLWSNANTRATISEFLGTEDLNTIQGIKTHASDNSPIAAPRRPFPLLIFSPGLGLSPYFYSAQLEDLASHGYIVAGIEHPEDTLATVLADGTVLPFDSALWSQHPPSEDEEQFYAQRATVLAADVSFVISQLLRLTRQSSSMWHNRIDPLRIGVFGHSQGGRGAGAACLLDPRIRACLNEDGSFDEKHRPYTPIQGLRIEGSFAMLDWFDPGFGASDFAAMHSSLAEYSKARLRPGEAALSAYRDVKGGSFRLTLLIQGMSHLSCSDKPYLRASTETAREEALARLTTVTKTVRAFFDEEFGRTARGWHCNEINSGVLVQCFH